MNHCDFHCFNIFDGEHIEMLCTFEDVLYLAKDCNLLKNNNEKNTFLSSIMEGIVWLN